MIKDKLKTLAARFEAAFPTAAGHKWRIAVFVLLFAVFLPLNNFAVHFPNILRRELNSIPLAEIYYYDAEFSYFPPSIELKSPVISGQLLRGAALRFDRLKISPLWSSLLTGRLGLRLTAEAGEGSAVLDLSAGSLADFSGTSLRLLVEELPLSVMDDLMLFDPGARGTINVAAEGDIQWMNAGGGPLPKDCALNADGNIKLASVRNDVAVLTFDYFRDGVFEFDLSLAGRTVNIRRMSYTDRSCGAVIGGKALVDWRNVGDSELNLMVEAKARPQDISPALMTSELRARLESGQALPFSLQGAIRNVQMKPVF